MLNSWRVAETEYKTSKLYEAERDIEFVDQIIWYSLRIASELYGCESIPILYDNFAPLS